MQCINGLARSRFPPPPDRFPFLTSFPFLDGRGRPIFLEVAPFFFDDALFDGMTFGMTAFFFTVYS